MKIVIAPDSFKGSMRSPEVCRIMREGILSVLPDADCVALPMADGGEGTTEAAVLATGGRFVEVEVDDPLGRPLVATFGVLGDGRTAIMEMAAASGLELLSDDELNPMRTSTYGTGQLLCAIMDQGIRHIIIGIGGSATVDGGTGMAQALGYRLLDRHGNDIRHGGEGLKQLSTIKRDNIHPRLGETEIQVASDVTNPLLGEIGAAHVYGPQKGATPEMVVTLETGLVHLADIWRREGLLERTDAPGDGAAGGLGAGLRAFCGARMVSGARLLIDATRLREHLADADLLITGEGRADAQTGSGKLCSAVAAVARQAGVPVLLAAGALEGDMEALNEQFDIVFSISSGHISLKRAIEHGPQDLLLFSKSLARTLRIGRQLCKKASEGATKHD